MICYPLLQPQTRTNNYILDYIELKDKGDIEVCEELNLMLDELKYHLVTGDITFDTKMADGYILWCDKIYRQSKGKWHGQTLELMLWEKAFATAVLSFRTESGTFYYSTSLLLIPRKNGKSEFVASMATYFLAISKGIDVCVASCDDKTISLLYKTISKALGNMDPKKKIFRKTISELENKKTDCRLFKVSNKSENKGDGYNIAFCIIDELHMLPDNEMVEELNRAMYANDNSLTIFITTEGDLEEGALEEIKERCRKKLYKETDTEDNLLAWIYKCESEAEVFRNEKSWYKANPSLGVTKSIVQLRKNVNRARENRGVRIGVLCKDFSIKQNKNGMAWIDAEYIKMRENKFSIKDFRGCIGVAGVDIALTVDLCAVQVLFFKKNDPHVYAWTHCFIPEGKLKFKDDKNAGAKYQEWADAGFLTIMQGLENDTKKIAGYIQMLNYQFGTRIVYCGRDPNLSKDFENEIKSANIKDEVVNQNAKTLTGAILTTETWFQHNKVVFDSPVFEWNLGNARIKSYSSSSNSDDVLIIKEKPEQKIDAVVAFNIAVETYRRHKSEIDLLVDYVG